MYPADGVIPEGRTMNDWERTNCPWYMEFSNWNHFITSAKQAIAKELQKGNHPANWCDSTKLLHFKPEVDKAVERLRELLPTGDPEYDGKKARAPAEKKKEAKVDTSTKTNSADTSGKAEGPSAHVETPTSKKAEGVNKPRDKSPPPDTPLENQGPNKKPRSHHRQERSHQSAKRGPKWIPERRPKRRLERRPKRSPPQTRPRSRVYCGKGRLLQPQTATTMRRTLAFQSSSCGTTARTK
ncbi:unnamed protein product [Calypogeia fissa]